MVARNVARRYSGGPRARPLGQSAAGATIRQFTIDVLENFRYSCALLHGFHAVLNRAVATEIDAAAVHWHSLNGPDDVENGIRTH